MIWFRCYSYAVAVSFYTLLGRVEYKRERDAVGRPRPLRVCGIPQLCTGATGPGQIGKQLPTNGGSFCVCLACLLAIQQQDDKKAHFSESHLILQVVPGKSPMMRVGNKCV